MTDLLAQIAHWFGSAVCHQWPTHSYMIAHGQLPLCARCTGMYLGGVLTIGYLMKKHPHATGLPRPWVLVSLVLFFLAWAGDGTNSFLNEIQGLPHLYQPQNLLRITTGMLMGVSLGTIAYVMFNGITSAVPSAESVLATPREFLTLLALGGVIVLAINSQWDPLLYPVTFLSLFSILALHTVIVTAFVASFLGRERIMARGLARVLVPGLGVAMLYLSGIALFRVWLGIALGYPI